MGNARYMPNYDGYERRERSNGLKGRGALTLKISRFAPRRDRRMEENMVVKCQGRREIAIVAA
jgi:hypothetical protein